MVNLLGPTKIRQLADQIGLRPTKTKGQNFVHDPNTVHRIVDLAQVDESDFVIEIGPGLGSLTLGLLDAGARVLAVEIDPILAKQLPKTAAQLSPAHVDHLTVVEADALEVTDFGPATKLISNLPYNVAVPVLLHLCQVCPSWQEALVMVQLEVAERLVAKPGGKSYGVPSVKLSWFGQAKLVGKVPPKVFWPVPNVDSGLVKVTRCEPPETTAQYRQVSSVIDAAFGQRRKMLRSALAQIVGSSNKAAEICLKAGVDPQLRGEKLSIEHFIAITEQLIADPSCKLNQ